MKPHACLVNLVELDPPRNGGLQRIAHLVAGILADLHAARRSDVHFVVGAGFANAFQDWLGRTQLRVIPFDAEHGFTPIFDHLRPDLIVSPLFGPFPMGKGSPFPGVSHVVSMPDVLALDRPEFFDPVEAGRRRAMYEELRHVALTVTYSQDARRRLLEHLGIKPENVIVVPPAGDFYDGPTEPLEASLRAPFVYYPANGWPHKRHELLFALMQHIWTARPEVKLVLTGWKPDGYVEGLCRRFRCQPEKIVDLGFIESPGRLASLYRRAEAMLFVSAYEGFGMPVLEAMHYGCPVLCAPRTSIPEVAGDGALYVTSDDPREWARVFLEDLPPRRPELIDKGRQQAQGFSWEQSRAAWTDVLERFGIDLTSPSPESRRHAELLSPAAVTELLAWAGRTADLHSDLQAKEQVIQNQLAAAGQQAAADAHAQALLESNQQLVEKDGLMRELLAANQKLLEQERSLHALQVAEEQARNRKLLDEERSRHAAQLAAERADKRLLTEDLLLSRRALAEQEAPLRRLPLAEQELVDKEAVIQSFRTSPGYWLANGPLRWFPLTRPLIRAHGRIRLLLQPRIGVLAQHAPRPMRVPRRYLSGARLGSAKQQLPSISIVTPSFNQGEFIGRTIRSVLLQAYPGLHYTIQDGGSTDDTLEVLELFRSSLAGLASGPDRGQAHALNLGFQAARGEIMAYLNADDVLLPGTLWYVGNFFRRHPKVDVVYGHRVIIDAEDQEIGRWVLPPHDSDVLTWADYVPQESLFWRRSLWDKVGAHFDESFQFAMDWDLLLRFRAAGARFRRLPRFLAAFRTHPNQKSIAQLEGNGMLEMNRLRERTHGRPVSPPEIRGAIRPFLARSVMYHNFFDWGILKY